MRNRVVNMSAILMLALATFAMIKLIIFFIGFFSRVGIDASAMASLS